MVNEVRGPRPALEISAATGLRIARLYNRAGGQKDARLMAAAPELLAALKDLKAMFDYYGEVSKDYMPQVDAIIAKAEGRSE